MKITQVLEAQRQANPGMRLYYLIQERQRLELAKLWNKAHAAVEKAKADFLDELARVVLQDCPIRSATESSRYFTITFPVDRPGYICPAELVVHIGAQQGHHSEGCFVQIRRHGESIAHRRFQISPRSTPAQIWARVRHYFLPQVDEEVELHERELEQLAA